MKFLRANFAFGLPDDFDGGLVKALRALADHVEAKETREEAPTAACFGETHHAFIWNLERGIKFTGKATLLDFPGNGWSRLEPGDVGGFRMDGEPDLWIK